MSLCDEPGLQVLSFRMLSRAYCSVEFHLGTSWNSYPVKLFSSLDHEHPVLRERECVLCPLSQLLVSVYDPDDWDNDEVQNVLATLASVYRLDISDVEARHASTRRITSIRGLQTVVPHLTSVSAEWVVRSNVIRRGELDLLPQSADASAAQGSGHDGQPEPAFKRNPWNAFLSARCHSPFHQDMATLQEEYYALTPEERQMYEEMADVAALAKSRDLQAYQKGVRGTESSSSTRQPDSGAGALVPLSERPESAQQDLDLACAGQVASDALCKQLTDALSGQNHEHQKQALALRQQEEECHRLRREYTQQDAVLRQTMSCCPPMLDHYTPALNGLLSVNLHIPADSMGKAPGTKCPGFRTYFRTAT